MIDFEISYNGQNFDNIEDAINKAMIDGIRNVIEKKLLPFKQEIKNSNGRVILDISANLTDYSIKLKDMPKSLTDKISQALE